ncbi:MAG: hypothetical protein PHU25_13025 [Deltaproteobacteria bacterium]|nr:hypothetical protein [Deltaproteobacteria bacterium]
MTWRRAVFAALAVVLSVFVTLLAVEIGLRCSRAKVLHKNIGNEVPITADDTVILALGESTTYGIFLPSAESSPALLEASLRAAAPERRYRVLNLAWPGAISSDIAACFYEAMRTLRPVAVLANLGHNDYSYRSNYDVRGEAPRRSSPFEVGPRITPRAEPRLMLLRVLFRDREMGRWRTAVDRTGQAHVFFQDNEGEVPADWLATKERAITRELTDNVARMAGTCKERNARFVLVGYMDSIANATLQALAKDLDVPYVGNAIPDAGVRMGYVIPRMPTGRVDGFHPNVRGQVFIRDNVLRKLEELGLVPRP